jgi:micrococcal nuclease
MKCFLYALLVSLISCSNDQTVLPSAFDGKVVSITDGDTFTILTQQNRQFKIRLYGIDCPERRQDFGNVAKQRLSELIFRKFVYVKKTDVDRYGRTVAIVLDENKNCVNELLLKEGLAWHYIKYDGNPNWQLMEDSARMNGIGLWSATNPIPPWLWRKK